jgi:tetratricopeptide (TPR) repeat protein
MATPNEEVMELVSGSYETGYDIVAAVMTKHVPVVTGIIGMIIVFLAPFAYDFFVRRTWAKDADGKYIPAPPAEPIPVEIDEEAEAQNGILQGLVASLQSVTDTSTVERVASRIDQELTRSAYSAPAWVAVAQAYVRIGNKEKGEQAYQSAMDVGGASKEIHAHSAEALASLASDKGDTEQALNFARKALFLFDIVGLTDKADQMTSQIRDLKSRIS